jgi:hypothetical protein
MSEMESARSNMTLYLRYEHYLMARQLGLIIVDIDDIHTLLCHGENFRREQVTFPDRARLRVERADTGSSIQLVFHAGQQLVAELLGLGSVVVGGASMLAATTALLVGAFSRIRTERQRAQLGAVAVEAERKELRAAGIERDIALRREQLALILEETIVQVAVRGTTLMQRTPEQNAELALKLTRPISSLDQQLNSGTLIQAALNGQDLATPRLHSDPEQSS